MKARNINAILAANPVDCRYGAPRGWKNCNDSTSPLLLQRIRFVDGDYSADGTYWGGSSPLWCAFNLDDNEFAAAMGTRIFVRASSRAEAMAAVLDRYPSTKFKRSA